MRLGYILRIGKGGFLTALVAFYSPFHLHPHYSTPTAIVKLNFAESI
jgi:hypothetical protein